MPKTLILAALAASALSAIPMAAQAAALRLGDLDLQSEAGKAELARRIEAAVREACPGEAATGTRMNDQKARKECETEARNQIEAHVARRMKRTTTS